MKETARQIQTSLTERYITHSIIIRLVVPSLLLCVASAYAQDERTVASFSHAAPGEGIPADWMPLVFEKIKRHTQYTLVEDSGTTVVKAVSENAVAGLTRKVSINPREYPVIQWRWKVSNTLEKGDVRSKDGDDYPARIYVTFAYYPDRLSFGQRVKYKAGRLVFGKDLPSSAINYIWAGNAEKGLVIDNAYTDFVKMIVVEGRGGGTGEWVTEKRNVFEDYKNAFGIEPPTITGIAIMTDTDNTSSSATAYYGDIVFRKK